MKTETRYIDKIETGERIRRLRTDKFPKQYEFAIKLGVSPELVSKWENGHILPGADNLLALSDYLGCKMDDLIVRKGEKA